MKQANADEWYPWQVVIWTRSGPVVAGFPTEEMALKCAKEHEGMKRFVMVTELRWVSS